jgi:hypothetical protein
MGDRRKEELGKVVHELAQHDFKVIHWAKNNQLVIGTPSEFLRVVVDVTDRDGIIEVNPRSEIVERRRFENLCVATENEKVCDSRWL